MLIDSLKFKSYVKAVMLLFSLLSPSFSATIAITSMAEQQSGTWVDCFNVPKIMVIIIMVIHPKSWNEVLPLSDKDHQVQVHRFDKEEA